MLCIFFYIYLVFIYGIYGIYLFIFGIYLVKYGTYLFFLAPKSLQMVTAAMKLKDAYSLEGKL